MQVVKSFAIVFSFYILYSSVVKADGVLEKSEAEEVLQKLDRIKNSLSIVGDVEKECLPGQSDSECSFINQCKALNLNKANRVVYEDRQGRKVMNYTLMNVLQSAEVCLPYSENKTVQSKNRKLQKENARRVVGIFKDAQKSTLEFLKSRRKRENALQIDNLIRRVQSVEPQPLASTSDVSQMAEVGCEMPNSYYAIESHQVRICPQLLDLPDATLFGILAHEIGHAIDPCNSSMNLMADKNGQYSISLFDAKQPSKTAIGGISLSVHPFRDVFNCLESESSAGAKTKSKDEVLNEINANIKTEPENLDYPARARLINSNFEQVRFCEKITRSQLQEASADWMESQALAHKLKEKVDPIKAKTFAMESQLMLMSVHCPQVFLQNKEVVAELSATLGNSCQGFNEYRDVVLKTQPYVGKSYPEASRRIDRIINSHPQIQRALKCTNNPQINGVQCK